MSQPNIIARNVAVYQTGPRTVIVPADPIEWDASTSYEYLTLVTYSVDGRGYVSKRNVPSGTLPTDTSYWIPVAPFNVDLEQIRQQLAQVQQTASEAKSKAENAESTAAAAQRAASTAQSTAESAASDASQAKSTATAAQSAASTAQSTAEEALRAVKAAQDMTLMQQDSYPITEEA